jgi:hypothetical protein
MLVPTTGTVLLAASAHEMPAGGGGGGGGVIDCQLMLIAASALVLTPLLAITLYVVVPAAAEPATQVLVALVHPTHAKLVGLPVQVAVNVMLDPTKGMVLPASNAHEMPEGGGAIACQLTLMAVGALALTPLLAVIE